MSKLIGKYVALAKKGTIIIPKEIPGYISPEGQILEEEGQKFQFHYTPINYNISYNLDGGELDNPKTSYTVEEEYIPGIPTKENYKFKYWTPEKINKGTIGDFIFKANWEPYAILKTGAELNQILDDLANGKEHIFAFQRVYERPIAIIDGINDDGSPKIINNYANVSCTDNDIIFAYNEGIIYVYSKENIYCNLDMSGAFEGLTLLRNINCFRDWICKEGTDISRLFKDCSLLGDTIAVEEWANGNFSNYSEAFKGTSALEAGRVPVWYRWQVIVNNISFTGKLISSIEIDTIPDSIIFANSEEGYNAITKEIIIDNPDIEYSFTYEPIKYEIRYSTDGGILENPKTQYTIEDETYYPPEPIKEGYKFIGWDPECINEGQIGNVSFIAKYEEM